MASAKEKPSVGDAEVRADAPKDPKLRTPEEWARLAAGKTAKPRVQISFQQPLWKSPRHRAAAACHGWESHKLSTADALLISEDDYKGALAAAGTGDIHLPAVSPFHRAAAEAECKRLEESKARAEKASGKGN